MVVARGLQAASIQPPPQGQDHFAAPHRRLEAQDRSARMVKGCRGWESLQDADKHSGLLRSLSDMDPFRPASSACDPRSNGSTKYTVSEAGDPL